MKLTINSTSLSNYTLTLKKMRKSIIHIQLKNKSCSNRMLYLQLETKKLQTEKLPRNRLQDHQWYQSTNRFQRLRSILQSGSFNKIWLLTCEALQIKVKWLRNCRSILNALTCLIDSELITV